MSALSSDQVVSSLSLVEKARLSFEIVAAYARIRWWLRRHDLPWVVAKLRRPRLSEPLSEEERPAAQVTGLRLGRAVGRALDAAPLLDAQCLGRSLVLTALLARRGIDSSLVIAVQSEPGFGAHAWVECNGVPLLPPGDPSYREITRL